MMRRNFDYVTMDDYTADTKEIVDRAAAGMARLHEEIDRLRKTLAAVVYVAGKVEVPRDLLLMGELELSRYDNFDKDTLVFQARRKERE